MPGSVISVGVILMGKDQLSGPVGQASQALGGFTQQAAAAAAEEKTALVMGAGFATMMAAKLTGGIKQAVGASMEFESSLLTLQRVTSLSDEQVQQLGTDFRGLATDLPITAAQLANVGVIAGKLGISAAGDIKKVAISATQLSAATEFTQESAAEAMARVSSLFKLKLEDKADSIASAISEMANASTATAPEIAAMTNRMGGMAQQMGITAPQALALAATMRDAGVQVEAGGSSVMSILSAMTSRQDKFAKALGMTKGAYVELFRTDPMGAFQKLLESMQGVDPMELGEKMKSLGLSNIRTKQTVMGLSTMSGQLAENLKKSQAAFEGGEKSGKMYNDSMRSLGQQIAKFRSNVHDAYMVMGDYFKPVLARVVGILSKFLGWFIKAPAIVHAVAAAVLALAAGMAILVAQAMALRLATMLMGKQFMTAAVQGQVLAYSFGMWKKAAIGVYATMKGIILEIWAYSKALFWNTIALIKNRSAQAGASTAVAGSVAPTVAASGATWGLSAAVWSVLWPVLAVIASLVIIIGVMYVWFKVLSKLTGAVKMLFVVFSILGSIFLPILGPIIALVAWIYLAYKAVVWLWAALKWFFQLTTVTKILSSFWESIKQVGKAFYEVGAEIWSLVSEVLAPFSALISTISDAFGIASTESGGFGKTLMRIVEIGIWAILLPLKLLTVGFRLFAWTVRALLWPIKVIIQFFALLAGIVSDKLVPIIRGWTGGLAWGIKQVGNAIQWLISIFDALAWAIGTVWDALFGSSMFRIVESVAIIMPALNMLLGIFSSILGVVGKIAGTVGKGIAAIASIPGKVVDGAKWASKKVGEITETAINYVGSVLKQAWEDPIGTMEKGLIAYVDTVKTVTGTVAESVKQAWEDPVGTVESGLQAVGDAALWAWDSLFGSGFMHIPEGVMEALPYLDMLIAKFQVLADLSARIQAGTAITMAVQHAVAAAPSEVDIRAVQGPAAAVPQPTREIMEIRARIPIVINLDGQEIARGIKEIEDFEHIRTYREPKRKFSGVCD
jgi:TP901 family phage tail tape measure protein